MGEKPPKKIAVTIKRRRASVPKYLIAKRFCIRSEKASLFMDLVFEVSGQRNERITLDPNLIRSSNAVLKQYVAKLPGAQDDEARKDDLPFPEQSSFANIVHFSQMGPMAETSFGIYSVADWVDAARSSSPGQPAVESIDTVVVMSTTGFQKKLLLDLIIAIEQDLQ